MKPLEEQFRAEIDQIQHHDWHQLIPRFKDGNIYQTWSYSTTRWRKSSLSHILLRKEDRIVSVAQVHILKVPLLGGIAYVRWGPLWRLHGEKEDKNTFRQMVRAMNKEYVGRRKLLLKILPGEPETLDDLQSILVDEGFQGKQRDYNTFLIDLTPPLEEIRKGLLPRWRTDLNRSEKNDLTLVQGTSMSLYDTFGKIYTEMFERKGLVDFGNLRDYRAIQESLPDPLKMKIMLCEHEGESIAGAITSVVGGDTGLAILWATNLKGRKLIGAYFLQWQIIRWLKDMGCRRYDLGGVNKDENPGGYQFKYGIAGKKSKEVGFLDQFVTRQKNIISLLVNSAQCIRSAYRKLRAHAKRPSWKTYNSKNKKARD